MSLLERLGRKGNNENLTKKIFDKELENKPVHTAVQNSGLSVRLKAVSHEKEIQKNSTEMSHVHTTSDETEVAKVDGRNLELISDTSNKLENELRLNLVKTNNEKEKKDSDGKLNELSPKLGGQRLAFTSSLNNNKLEDGLSARLGLSQETKKPSISSAVFQSKLELKTNKEKKLNDTTVMFDKNEKLSIMDKATESAEVKKEVINNVSASQEGKVNKSKIVSGGLGAKLGLGTKAGLGARLGNDNERPTNSGLESSKVSLNSKMITAKPMNSEQNKYQNLKIEIHRQIIEELSIEQQKIIANSSSDRSELEHIVVELCNKVIDGDNPTAMSRAERMNIVNDIVDEVLGLGPIEPLLKDDTVSEVMINGPKMVYVERKGKLTLTDVQFQDETHLMNIVERIVAPLGRRIDESSPLVDARLADGSRVNIIIPPLALNGACVTIRKFAKDPLTINNLIAFGSLDDDMASLIKSCVLGRLNVVVSGGTGSGKTTTLNVLSSFIPEDERIVTIEDAAELQLRQEHVVTLESRPANVEGNGQVSIRDLVRNALRMRPDRIVVGECRSGEALDMLQAMNTGHDGSLTTAHANSPRDVISRLETMVLMAGMELPVKAIREQIASAVDLIIQQSRLRDGSRKITHITEVQGMEGDVIVLQDLFRFEQDGLDEYGKLRGEFRTSGIRPKFLEKLETNGIKLDCDMFLGNRGWQE